MQSDGLDSVASERLSHAGKIFTSDLSINEFALLHGAGFEPIELVMGVSVYHVGFQFSGIRQQQELRVLTEATYRARWNAMQRMQAEADALEADGIVGVRLRLAQSGRGRRAPGVHRGGHRGALHRQARGISAAQRTSVHRATSPARTW